MAVRGREKNKRGAADPQRQGMGVGLVEEMRTREDEAREEGARGGAAWIGGGADNGRRRR
jgi:hypothetical protein